MFSTSNFTKLRSFEIERQLNNVGITLKLLEILAVLPYLPLERLPDDAMEVLPEYVQIMMEKKIWQLDILIGGLINMFFIPNFTKLKSSEIERQLNNVGITLKLLQILAVLPYLPLERLSDDAMKVLPEYVQIMVAKKIEYIQAMMEKNILQLDVVEKQPASQPKITYFWSELSLSPKKFAEENNADNNTKAAINHQQDTIQKLNK